MISFYLFDINIVIEVGFFLLIIILAWQLMKLKSDRESVKLKLEKLNVESQLIYMRNQLNPHFLFNSFNTLMGIIEEGNLERSAKFVEDLSDLYRIILEVGKLELVSFREEFDMVKLFVNILNERFENTIRLYCCEIPNELKIPPLTLQLLVENAVKHNEFNLDNPLTIKIMLDNNTIRVWNNRRRKKYKVKSTGNGLANINNRYQLLVNKTVELNETEEKFEVILPIILESKDGKLKTELSTIEV